MMNEKNYLSYLIYFDHWNANDFWQCFGLSSSSTFLSLEHTMTILKVSN
ncbi:hypothetical protein BpHYR1_036536 [Brachionus plicatilis]|uniref:Uncharacterized protein n=1 Tax=Brachionus plicatilis TaxID=10195 RepID=A0A3M7QLT8_BRAPC|nr:hypothetical protein BpHYR1_036536 [Brachionus plicatilis]